MTYRILAVCLGNICRSPAAEAAIRREAAMADLDVVVDSAGTGSWHMGQEPHPQIVSAGAKKDLVIEGRARRFSTVDFERFDVIVVMDRSNLRDVLSMAPTLEGRAKVRLFRTYDPSSEEDEIPDPWGGPDEGYEKTVSIVTAAAHGLVAGLSSTSVQDPITLE